MVYTQRHARRQGEREGGREGGREGWREEGREGGREGERPISHTDKGEVVKARIVTVVERRRKVDRWLYVSGVGGCRELGLRVSACQRSVPSFLSPSLSASASLSTLSPLMSLSAFPLPLPLPRHLPPCLLFSLSHLADTTHTHTHYLSLSPLEPPPLPHYYSRNPGGVRERGQEEANSRKCRLLCLVAARIRCLSSYIQNKK